MRSRKKKWEVHEGLVKARHSCSPVLLMEGPQRAAPTGLRTKNKVLSFSLLVKDPSKGFGEQSLQSMRIPLSNSDAPHYLRTIASIYLGFNLLQIPMSFMEWGVCHRTTVSLHAS